MLYRLSDEEDDANDNQDVLNSFEAIDKLPGKNPVCNVTAKVVFVGEEKITKDKK